MPPLDFDPGKVIAIAFIAGFAIQQFLQILDLPITGWVIRDKETVWSMPAADFKKSLMFLLSFIFGWFVASALGINLLEFAIGKDKSTWLGDAKAISFLGTLISGFVLGSGTEAANTLIKYFGYLKDAKKYDIEPEIEVSIIPPSATVRINETVKFESVVKDDKNQAVTWKVLQGSTGGQVNTDGEYKAPATPGIYELIVTSQADKTKSATVKVTVKA